MSLLQSNLFDVEDRTRFPVHVRTAKNLSPNEKALVKSSGLSRYAPVEAWTADGSNRDLSYATHGVFRYFGKFPPPIATHLIGTTTAVGDLVIDPMCGSGTTGVECLLHNRRAALFDVNPLSLLLARAKTRFLPSALTEDAVQRVLKNYNRPDLSEDYRFPMGLRNADHWFLPETTQSLRRLRAAIDREKDELLHDFLLLIFASTVRRVSRATTQQGRLFLDAATAEPDALPTFTQRSRVAIKAVASLPKEPKGQVTVASHDLRLPPPRQFAGKAALVILHPPYFNGYRYTTINALELAWLGEPVAEVRPAEVREFFKVGKKKNVSGYVADMKTALLSAFSMVAPGGYLALMIGDTMIHGEYIPVVRMLLDELPDMRVTLETVAIRIPKHTEASWVASQRRKSGNLGITLYDFILTFRTGK